MFDSLASMPGFMMHVRCNSCGNSAYTSDGSDPDNAVKCDCCPQDHSHAGDGCSRTVTITAFANLTGTGSAG